MKNIIFTDLDGTFLNHDNYSFKDAKEALTNISAKKIPLIFTTSKTRFEVELLQKKVGIQEPFIVENGAAIFIPKNYMNLDFSFLDSFDNYYIFQLGKSYNEVLDFYNKYKHVFAIKGFSDMSEEEVSSLTGLSLENSFYSKQRDFTEPFVIDDETKIESLKELALIYGIKITKGGRFYHLLGEKQDKGVAVKKATEILSKISKESFKTIALGDGENDIEMLQNVDISIIIKNHKNKYIETNINNVQKSTFKGAKGWNEMVLKNV